MSLLILVVDDEPGVEDLFRQQFRLDLRAGRFVMQFAQSAPATLQHRRRGRCLIDPDPVGHQHAGMTGLELLPKAKALRPDVPVIMITAYGDADTKRKALEDGAEALLTKPIDFAASAARSTHGSSAPRHRNCVIVPSLSPALILSNWK